MKAGKLLSILAGAAILATTGASGAVAKDAGDFLVRFRGIAVTPNSSGTTDVIGGQANIDESYVPELDFTYFFTENIAAELILGTTKHDVTVSGTTLPGDADLGSVWLLPPTLTLQYHFMPKSDFSPYLGAGVNYTMFYNQSGESAPVTKVEYEDSFGFALQAGIDYKLDENWSLNFDVKKIFLETDVKVNGGAINAKDVNIDPWIFGIGIGYKF